MSSLSTAVAGASPNAGGRPSPDWPAPRPLRLIDPGPHGEPERARITPVGGEKLLGTVPPLDFEAGLSSCQRESGRRRELPFGEFRSLLLHVASDADAVPRRFVPAQALARDRVGGDAAQGADQPRLRCKDTLI